MSKQINKQQQLYLKIIGDLHAKWQPHEGQLQVGKRFLNDALKTVFLQCGRKWGKTEFAIYMLWRHSLLNPGSACYYVCPEMTHGKNLVWTDPRLTSFGPSEYISKINSNEMLIKFKNGSFIKIIGSENYAAANGLRPSLLVYDEFCEFHPSFHETMNPNRIVRKCPLLIIGTPPKSNSRNKEQYVTYADECREQDNAIWISQTSYNNPLNDPKDLDAEREALFKRGEEWIWYSQYEAKMTAGGKHVVFPMLNKEKHVKNHKEIMREIRYDQHKLDFYCIADPGTTTIMAFLFAAINPYTRKIYILDEIYENKPSETSVRLIIPRAEKVAESVCGVQDFDKDWTKGYDEAAAWFSNEVLQQFGYFFEPTLKAHNKKEHGISLIKDILIHDVCVISDRCENLVKEMENYVANEDGKLPKKNDHLIDCFRYLLSFDNYDMVAIKEAARHLGPRKLDMSDTRKRSLSDDIEEYDWTEIYE